MLGSIALGERRYADAAREYHESDQGNCLVCQVPFEANAWDLAGQPDSAIARYEHYIDTRQPFRATTDEIFLAGSHKRLGELYEAKGDKQNALTHYLKFVDLWKDADAELQPRVGEVRARIARLKDQERR